MTLRLRELLAVALFVVFFVPSVAIAENRCSDAWRTLPSFAPDESYISPNDSEIVYQHRKRYRL